MAFDPNWQREGYEWDPSSEGRPTDENEDDRGHRPKTRLRTFLARTLNSPIRALFYTIFLGIRAVWDGFKRLLPVRTEKGYARFSECVTYGMIGCDECVIDPVRVVIELTEMQLPIKGKGSTRLRAMITEDLLTGMRTAVPQIRVRSKILAERLGRAIGRETLPAMIHHEWAFVMGKILTFMADNVGMNADTVEGVLSLSEVTRRWDIGNSVSAVFNPDGLTIRVENTGYIMTRETACMIGDIHAQFAIQYLAAYLDEVIGTRTSLSPAELTSLKLWGLNVLKLLGRNGYEVIACMEPIGYAVLMMGRDRSPDPYVNDTYLNSILSEFPVDSDARACVEALLTIYMSFGTPHKVSDAFGLFRMLGHPMVDGADGIEKMRRLSKKVKIPDQSTAIDLGAIMAELFVRSFVKKHKRWPNCSINLPPRHPFHHARLCGYVPAETHPLNNTASWAAVEFNQEFEPPRQYNLADIIDDKSCSPNKHELYGAWMKSKTAGWQEQKKLILRWFTETMVKPSELLEEIDAHGFREEDKLIGLTPKERELKLTPRMFSLMTFKFRTYQVLTESMVADEILPHFPQITMTMSNHELTKRLISRTRPQSGGGRDVHITVNIDFQKWNTNMRHGLVKHVFERLDNLFGFTNLIRRTHEYFQEAKYYLAEDGTNLSFDRNGELIDGPYVYTGSYGGNEGLRQKPWTIVTVCGIYKVARDLKIKHQITGQGDNQVVTLIFPDRELPSDPVERSKYCRDKSSQFLTRLSQYFAEVGLPVKTEETWMSSRLYAYGKRMFLEGVPLKMFLKKIGRAFALSNEFVPSLEEDLARVWSATSAAVELDLTPYVGYVLGCCLSAQAIRNHLIYSPVLEGPLLVKAYERKFINYDGGTKRGAMPGLRPTFESLVKSICWKPKAIGGWPVLMLEDLIIKGFPDPATSALAQLKSMVPYTSGIDREIILSCLNLPLSSVVSPSMLLKDPAAINTITTPSAGDILQEVARDYVTDYPLQNPQLRAVVKNVKTELDTLASDLFKCEPFFPPLMSDIFSASLPAYQDRIVRKCSTTSTIRRKAAERGSDSLLNRMKRNEINKMMLHLWATWGRSPLARLDTRCLTTCTKQLAQQYRNQSWGKQIHGVSVGHPLELFGRITPSHRCLHEEDHGDFLQTFASEHVNQVDTDITTTLGPFYPYIGSETRERAVKVRKGVNYVVEPLLKPAVRLLRAINWFIPEESDASHLLSNLLASVTDINPQDHYSSTEVGGGNAVHRYSCRLSDKLSRVNNLYQLHTYLSVTTERLTKYSRGSKNTDAHFQSMMIYAQSRHIDLILESLHTGEMVPLECHHHIECNHCIEDIPDEPITGDPAWTEVKFPSSPQEPFLYIRQQDLPVKDKLEPVPRMNIVRLAGLGPEAISELAHYFVAFRVIRASETDVDPNDVLSWTWLSRIDPDKLVEYIVHVFASLEWHHVLMSGVSVSVRDAFFKMLVSKRISETPLSSFYYLANLFVDPQTREALMSSKYGFSPPAETVPNANAAAAEIRRCCANSAPSILESALHSREVVWMPGTNNYGDVVIWSHYIRLRFSEVKLVDITRYQQWWRQSERDPYDLVPDMQVLESDLDTLMKRIPRLMRKARRPPLQVIREDLDVAVINADHPAHSVLQNKYRKLIFREPKIITGAVYKYLSLKSELTEFTSAMVIGDGTGGITAAMMADGIDVWYQTLVNYDHVTQQGLSVQAPAALDLLRGAPSGRLLNPGRFASFGSDLTDPRFTAYFDQYPPFKVDTLWSDAEGDFWDKPSKLNQYFENIIALRHRFVKTNGQLVVKVYLTQDTATTIEAFRKKLSPCAIIVSLFSTEGSTECFVLSNLIAPDTPVDLEMVENIPKLTSLVPQRTTVKCYSRRVACISKRWGLFRSPSIALEVQPFLHYITKVISDKGTQLSLMAVADTMINSYKKAISPRVFDLHRHRAALGFGRRSLHLIWGMIISPIAYQHFENPAKLMDVLDMLTNNISAFLSISSSGFDLSFSVSADRDVRIDSKLVRLPLFEGSDLKFMKTIMSTLGSVFNQVEPFKGIAINPSKLMTVKRTQELRYNNLIYTKDAILFPNEAAKNTAPLRANMVYPVRGDLFAPTDRIPIMTLVSDETTPQHSPPEDEA
ncbi:L [Farmington virus]|uniref:L n=1 Tax=Farmington virus TaxID=1027468 RepID=UPI000387A55F|nr:L [Farmington virus] [Farmington virus]AGN91191.1 L [Farmington virus] [Farmington virus]